MTADKIHILKVWKAKPVQRSFKQVFFKWPAGGELFVYKISFIISKSILNLTEFII